MRIAAHDLEKIPNTDCMNVDYCITNLGKWPKGGLKQTFVFEGTVLFSN